MPGDGAADGERVPWYLVDCSNWGVVTHARNLARNLWKTLPGPTEGLADDNPPVSARPLDDADKERTPGLTYLGLVNGSLHKAQGLEDDVLGDGRRGKHQGRPLRPPLGGTSADYWSPGAPRWQSSLASATASSRTRRLPTAGGRHQPPWRPEPEGSADGWEGRVVAQIQERVRGTSQLH